MSPWTYLSNKLSTAGGNFVVLESLMGPSCAIAGSLHAGGAAHLEAVEAQLVHSAHVALDGLGAHAQLPRDRAIAQVTFDVQVEDFAIARRQAQQRLRDDLARHVLVEDFVDV